MKNSNKPQNPAVGPVLLAAALLMGASGAQASYPDLILTSHPVAYYRLEEAADAVTAVDSTDNHFDGTYVYGQDPLSVTYPQLGQPGIDINSALFKISTPTSFVDLPYQPDMSPTLPDGLHGGPFSVECWAEPTTQPSDYSVPLSNFGAYSTGAYGNASGWNFYQTPGPSSSWNFNLKNGAFLGSGVTIELTKWYYLAATFDGSTAVFYVNGVQVGSQGGIAGYLSNPQYNAQIGAGDNTGFLPFAGGVDEVAFYTNVLSSADIAAHYAEGTNSFRAVATPPVFLQEPASLTNYAGFTVTFSSVVSGTAPLSYQWKRAGDPIPGATNSSYSFQAAYPGDDGATFSLTVTNSIGSANAGPVTLTVLTNLNILGAPFSIARNEGSYAAFRVGVTGAGPISYRWSKNSTPLSGETNATLWLPGVSLADDGATYAVTLTNPFVSTNLTATLNVHPRAATAPSTPYSLLVAADHPVAYWRLDGAADSAAAVDTAGSFDGTFFDTADGGGVFSYQVPTGIPNDSDTALGISSGATVKVPYALELNPDGDWAVETWFSPASLGADGGDYRVILSSEYNLFPNPYHGWYIYQQPNGTIAFVPQPGNQFIIEGPNDPANNNVLVPGKWYHLVVTKDAAAFTVYINGEARGSFPVPGSGFIQNGINGDTTVEGGDFVIGKRTDGAFNPFSGTVDDTAVYNYSLPAAKILAHYLNSPRISIQQSGDKVVLSWAAGALQFSPAVNGTFTNLPAATSPYTYTPDGLQGYFRLLIQP
ncbi:MAG TPA: LamG-like jellyroll fold domain-containing protein [Candidatus Limnocylindria bacterium]|nr:LamG-like jellyroll fold domain-containing protein [Candidatus Limnocylindria bacterium]